MDNPASSSPTASRFADPLNALVLLLLVCTAIPLVAHAYRVIAFGYQVNYSEGQILDQVVRLSRFENIYEIPTAYGPYSIANFPPLYYLIQVPFAWAVGPALWYGRAISLVATIATAFFIGATVHTLTRDRVAAVVSSLIFVSIPYVILSTPINRIDTLALCLIWGALFVISRWPDARWSLFAIAVLFVAAGFTRQTSLLAGPLAAFVLLVKLGHIRRALRLAAVVTASCLLVGLALNAATGGGFYFGVVIVNISPLLLAPLSAAASDVVRYMPFLLIFAVLLFAVEKAAGVRWFLLPYLAGAVAVTITIMKLGSGVNYLLELSAALSACAGVLVAAVRTRSPVLRKAVSVGLVSQALLLASWWHGVWSPQVANVIDPVVVERVREIVARAEGPVLLEDDIALLPLSGRPVYFQPFEMKQLVDSGHWDQSVFVRSIEERRYAVIVMRYPSVEERWTAEMREAISSNYAPAEPIVGKVVYRPLPPREGETPVPPAPVASP
jgi:hypothetical protein